MIEHTWLIKQAIPRQREGQTAIQGSGKVSEAEASFLNDILRLLYSRSETNRKHNARISWSKWEMKQMRWNQTRTSATPPDQSLCYRTFCSECEFLSFQGVSEEG